MTFYLSYSTANDDPEFAPDRYIFGNLAKFNPGVDKVVIFTAISEVKPRSDIDDRAIADLKAIAAASSWLEWADVSFKGNVGRDFSSAAANLRRIAQQAKTSDSIFFINRSAYGPLMDDWYSQYVDQLKKFPNAQLCGSTINQSGHPKAPRRPVNTHVQSYAYLSEMQHMLRYLDKFPGEQCTTRNEAIVDGEIALSLDILHNGGGLTCLMWPDVVFDRTNPVHWQKSWYDQKNIVDGVPFVYKRELPGAPKPTFPHREARRALPK